MTESLQAQRAKASLQAKLAEDTFNDPEASRILRRMGAATTNVDALLGTCGNLLEPVQEITLETNESADDECSSDETLQLMRSLLAVLQDSVDETNSDDEAGNSAVAAISQLVRTIS